MLKLLTREQITNAKVTDQLREIQEGKKLAERVDRLRGLQAIEEASLDKFRTETLSRIHEETTEALKKRDFLFGEVRELEERRKAALAPLTEERVANDKENARLDTRRKELDAEQYRVEDATRLAENTLKTAENELSRAQGKTVQAEKLLSDASSKCQETELALKDAQKVKDASIKLAKEVEQDLINRDSTLAARERGVQLRQEALDEREKKLMDGWSLLNDRLATFERNLKRK